VGGGRTFVQTRLGKNIQDVSFYMRNAGALQEGRESAELCWHIEGTINREGKKRSCYLSFEPRNGHLIGLLFGKVPRSAKRWLTIASIDAQTEKPTLR